MSFKQSFDANVCEGDHITCEVDGFTCRATIYRDDDCSPPDERQDGFWPSKDPEAAGYCPPDIYSREMLHAQRVMNAWRNDEWFYCGVAVTVSRNGVALTGKYHNALWGVECNYPDSDNSYLLEVANELLSEALSEAKAVLKSLSATWKRCSPANVC